MTKTIRAKTGIVLSGQFYTNILILSFPMILQQLLRVSVDTLDSIMLGRIDQLQMSAVSQAQQIFFIFYTVCCGIGAGGCVLVAQYWGKQDREKIKTLCAIGIKSAAVFGVIFSAIVMIWPDKLLRIYSSDPELIRIGASYLRIAAIMYPVCAVSTVMFAWCRGIEEMKVSFTTNAISYPLNVVLDYCLIFGKFGMPELGIQGAAVGAVIARIVELLILSHFVFVKEKKISMKPVDLKRKDGQLTKDFWLVSAPIIGHELIWSTGTTAGSSITGQMGTVIVSGYNVANVFYQLLSSVMNGVLHACSVVMGKTIGSGKDKEQVQREAYSMIVIGLVGGSLVGVVTLIFGGLFVNLYALSAEAAVYARTFMLIFAAIWPFSGMEMTGMVAVLRAGGDGKMGLICDIFSMWMITIPLAAACAFYFGASPYLVVAIIKVNIAIEALVAVFRIFSGKWIRNLTH
ncbi:MAG: MATE family efflux transporter [Lachnoclostridium sp.]|nr:MATE family efflux transporter [Lachnoclostridium sp.]